MIGQTVSHYRILEELGGGGMGVVYKAEDTRLKRTVALKFLPPELTRDRDAKTRFVHEAQAASALLHHNICTIHEIDESSDGRLFIAMDCYDGETLKKKIDRGPLPVDEALDITAQVAAGLGKAHKAGMIHRDIKPANIIVTTDGEAKILDFGLAKLAGMTKITKTGTAVGTVAYMSPEQATGREVDERSDIFSLGSVLYELLTGHAPFESDHEAAELYRILSEHPEPIGQYRTHCPEGLQRVLDKALQKEPDRRYQTVTELEEDLRRLLQGIMPAAKRSRRRSRAMIWLVASAVALVALAASPALQTIRAWIRTLGEVEALHVAVLPFENVAGDPESQVFCDGLMETLTSKLSQLEQFYGSLWVVPASEVRKSGIASAAEAAGAFGANLAITGSIQPISDGIRLTMNLVSVASRTPRQLRSSVTDIRTIDIALLQDQTVRDMAGMLNIELAPTEQTAMAAGNTNVSQAYDAYVRARGYLHRSDKVGNIDLAIDGFTRAAEQDPSYALAYAGLADAYWLKYNRTGDKSWIPLAMENCDRAVELNEELAPVHVSIGTVYEGTGRYEEAEEHYRRAITLDPANVAAYGGLASSCAHLGRLDEAEAAFRKAIEMKPDLWVAHNGLGMFYYRYGRYEEAVGEFREVARLTPDNVWAYLNLGASLYYLDRWEDAAEMFRRAIDITPSRAAYNNLATLEYIQGNYAEAARTYLKALSFEKAEHGTWANLGNSYYWAPGERDKAKDAYRRALALAEERLEVNPRDAKTLADIASYLAMLGDARGAHERLEESLAIDSEDVFVVYYAAHTYEQLGERDPALRWLEKAIENGYSVKEITRDPFMQELKKDPRFIELLEGRGE